MSKLEQYAQNFQEDTQIYKQIPLLAKCTSLSSDTSLTRSIGTIGSDTQRATDQFNLQQQDKLNLSTDSSSINTEEDIQIIQFDLEIFNQSALNQDSLKIIKYLKSIEVRFDHYNESHSLLRAFAIDWLIDKQVQLKLKCTTLFIALHQFNVYINKETSLQLNANFFKLIAGTLLFVAAKYEEIYPPSLKDFCNCLQISKQDIIMMETRLIQILGFNFSEPNIYVFMESYISLQQFNEYDINLAKYLVHLSLFDIKLNKILPSRIAAASLLVVLKLQNMEKQNLWNDQLQEITGFAQSELEVIANVLYMLLLQVQQVQVTAVFKKFSLPEFQSISIRQSKMTVK